MPYKLQNDDKRVTTILNKCFYRIQLRYCIVGLPFSFCSMLLYPCLTSFTLTSREKFMLAYFSFLTQERQFST